MWQQHGDSEVYVGSWAHSYRGTRSALSLPAELFDGYQVNQSAMVAALPGLRPGVSINQDERITSVTLVDTQMAIRWKTQSAAQRHFPELTGATTCSASAEWSRHRMPRRSPGCATSARALPSTWKSWTTAPNRWAASRRWRRWAR